MGGWGGEGGYVEGVRRGRKKARWQWGIGAVDGVWDGFSHSGRGWGIDTIFFFAVIAGVWAGDGIYTGYEV